jgi:hypothetical protein
LKQTEKKDVELRKCRKIRRWNLVRKEHKEKKEKINYFGENRSAFLAE